MRRRSTKPGSGDPTAGEAVVDGAFLEGRWASCHELPVCFHWKQNLRDERRGSRSRSRGRETEESVAVKRGFWRKGNEATPSQRKRHPVWRDWGENVLFTCSARTVRYTKMHF